VFLSTLVPGLIIDIINIDNQHFQHDAGSVDPYVDVDININNAVMLKSKVENGDS
jgi:hypothetical protein